MLQRAYSVLTVKSVDVDGRTITGVASTPTPDRMGDIVEPKGIHFKNPLPLLLFHDTTRPVGTVKFDKPTDEGITFTAKLVDPAEVTSATLKERVAEAWDSIKAKLIRGVSIGFRPLTDGMEFMRDTGGIRFTETEVLELSLVTIPANAEATITTIKSIDAAHLAALGDRQPESMKSPGVSGLPRKAMKTNAERIAAFKVEKQAKVDAMNALAAKSDDGSTLSADDQTAFDTLKDEVKALDGQITRLEELDTLNKSMATQVDGGDPAAAARSRSGAPVVTVQNNLPKGIGFARAVKAAVVARIDGRNMIEVAKEMYPSDTRLHQHVAFVKNLPNLVSQMKGNVAAGTTLDSTWAGALVDPTNLAGEFIEFLRPETIIGKLNLRRVPFNIRVIEQTQGGTGYWVGQGAPKPLTSFGFAPVTLPFTKVAAISVITEELARFSTPSAEELVRNGLRDALVERIDVDLVDPASAGSANVQPASLTYGLVAQSSAGTSADNVRTDIANLVQALRQANLRGRIVLLMPDSLAIGLSFMANSLGQPEFPELTADGGTIRGLRVITSNYLANPSGPGNMVVAIAESEVFLADDGQVTIDASREASLQMLDNPTNNSATATATQMVSMWQTNSIALRAERFINWQKRRSDAVVYMDDVNWGSVGSPA